jgi:phage FluMu protein Com
MGDHMAKSKNDIRAEQSHITKKCPQCFTYAPMDALKCPRCKTRIRKVDKHGMAIKDTDWGSYLLCLLAWAVLAIYVWYAFFRA